MLYSVILYGVQNMRASHYRSPIPGIDYGRASGCNREYRHPRQNHNRYVLPTYVNNKIYTHLFLLSFLAFAAAPALTVTGLLFAVISLRIGITTSLSPRKRDGLL